MEYAKLSTCSKVNDQDCEAVAANAPTRRRLTLSNGQRSENAQTNGRTKMLHKIGEIVPANFAATPFSLTRLRTTVGTDTKIRLRIFSGAGENSGCEYVLMARYIVSRV